MDWQTDLTIVTSVGKIVRLERLSIASTCHADPHPLPTASSFGHRKQRLMGNNGVPAKAVFCRPINRLTTVSHWSDDRVDADEFNSDPTKKPLRPVVRRGNAGFAKETLREMHRETVLLPAMISVFRQFVMGGEYQSSIPMGPDTTQKSSENDELECFCELHLRTVRRCLLEKIVSSCYTLSTTGRRNEALGEIRCALGQIRCGSRSSVDFDLDCTTFGALAVGHL